MKKSIKIKLKIGDKVKIIAGKEKGKVSTIKKILRLENQLIIEGVNIKTKHCKLDKAGKGEKFKRVEYPIHRSNVLKYKE